MQTTESPIIFGVMLFCSALLAKFCAIILKNRMQICICVDRNLHINSIFFTVFIIAIHKLIPLVQN